tara:strand:+ start:178 stop:888 length:711 start_codon:yes stop_codon:yes gene_type:complete
MALPELNTARYSIEIPSTGQTVTYRPYLVKEEKILMMAMETNDQKVIMQATIDVIKSCVDDIDDVESLAMFDIETLFLALRAKSVGEKIDLKMKCNDETCDTRTDVVVDFEEIQNPVVNNDETKIMLTDDVGVIMRYPSVRHVNSFTDVGDEGVESAMSMIIACIDSIFDADDVYDSDNESKQSLTKFIESLSSVQFMKLTDFFNSMPSVSCTIDYKCACGKDNTQELKGLQSFFT